MTFYALVTISFNRKFLSQEAKELQDNWSTENYSETIGIIQAIFFVTIVVELCGAVLMYPLISSHVDGVWNVLFYSIFHSISAFCNAGFSLFSDNMILFSDSFSMMSILSVLILLGGLVFLSFFNCITDLL